MTITVSTDGSALGNPNGPIGWAWADHTPRAGGKPGHEHPGDCDAGGATNGTNQIGELCAVLEALRAHPGTEPLIIETDSQYAINCSTKWVHGWKKNGWKNSQKKPVKNAALIKAIDAELSRRAGSVKFVWVKGHAGNAGNEKVDELARTYAGDCRSGARDGYLPKEGWESLLASEYSKGTDVPADAQMLMDGHISAEEYHLGRGESSDGSPAPDGSNPAGPAAPARGSSGSRTGSRSLADVLSEPEGVPQDLGGYTAGAVGAYDTASANDAADKSGPLDSPAASAGDAGDVRASRSSASAASPSSDADQHADAPADDFISGNGDQDTIPSASQATAPQPVQTPQPTQAPQPAANPTANPATRPAVQPSGLTVSGTLRFSPPPSSSPTYDGTPRLIRGLIAVEGYVDGDGTITLEQVPFAIRHS